MTSVGCSLVYGDEMACGKGGVREENGAAVSISIIIEWAHWL